METLFASKKDLSVGSKKTYTVAFNKNVEEVGDDFYHMSEKKYLEKLNQLSDDVSNNTKYSMLNLNIMLRKLENNPVNILVKAREKLSDAIATETVVKLNDLELPTYTEYVDKIDRLEKIHPQQYIVNKLILMFGFRNMDLNMIILKNTKKKMILDLNKNYMIIKAKEIELFINVYKTSKRYGQKVLKFSKKDNRKLYEAIKNYHDAEHHFLLDKKNRLEIAPSSLPSQIRYLTFNYGTSSLFKMIVKHFREKGDLDKLNELSKSRGTSMDVIAVNYNKQSAST
tara:strand:+ start:484 stop:1335 length:852 start_codon:yes stop_codon:yes gene_type:complete